MRSGASAVQHLLSLAALGVLKHAVTEAQRRGHPQVQPLHVVSMLLTHAGSRLRQACMLSHPQNSQTAECRALEVCFNVALDHLPQSAMAAASQPILSNALMAALKRAHAHQRRGCPEHQHSPLLAVKVEIDQLIISILDDPSVSRVMKEAGFCSTNVKFNLEDGPASAAAAAVAAAAVTVASGGAHVGHEPQPARNGVDMVSQGISFYDNSCVIQEENETKSSVKISPGVMNHANSMGSWQQSEVLLEGERTEMMLRVSSRANLMAGPAVSLPSREEDIYNIVEVLLAPRNRNAILIGDTTVGANCVVEDLAFRIKNGTVPAQLQGLQYLDPKLSSSSFGYCSSLEIEQKLAELSKIVEECMPAGAILHIGDLQWLAEPLQLKKGPSTFCPAQRTATELRKLLIRHANSRLWFVGVVTRNIFARLQVLYPSLASDWSLQALQVTTTFQPPQPTFLQRISSNLQTVNDQQILKCLPVRASSPIVTSVVQDSRHLRNNGVTQKFQCCPDCLSKFEDERRQFHESERLSLQLAPVKWCSPNTDEATSGGVNGVTSQAKQSIIEQLAPLQQKWQKICRTQHGEPTPVLTLSQLQSPLSRLSASFHSKPCGLGLDMSSQWSSLQNRHHLGSSLVDQHLRTPSSIPTDIMYAARDQLTASQPLQSAVQRVQEVVTTAVSGNTKPSKALDFSSPKDCISSVASAPEEHEHPNGSTGTSAQDASLASIHTNLVLGRANAVGFNFMGSKLRAPQPNPVLTQPSPLYSVGASPITSLKANSGKPAWLTHSPLQSLQQRRPVSTNTRSPQGGLSLHSSPSPMARRQANITNSPSPPPMPLKEVTVDDNLKGLYKGLMLRVPWQAAAVAGISATVMRCRSGGSGFRGATAKTDTWLLLLGPDPVAKHAIAKALAELVFGGERSLIHLGFAEGSPAKLEADDNGNRYRALTPLDRLAEAVRLKPSAVILLEDIDKAASFMKGRVMRAMEIGKLADSNGREVSFSNTIVVMTTSVGSELCEPKARPGSLSFSEAKFATLVGRAGIRGKVKDSRSCDKVVLEASNRRVVVVDHGDSRQQKESSPAPDHSSVGVPFWVPKRKADSLLINELRSNIYGKRTKSSEGRFLNLDLNLATGDASEGTCWTDESQSTYVRCDCEDEEEAKLQKVLVKARFALSEKFCALPDYAVGFDAYDFNGLATEVLNKLGKALEVHAPCEVGTLEVDLQLLEHIISCVWKMPGGRQVFNAWIEDVFAKSIPSLSRGAVVELMAELPEVEDGGDDVVALPHSIVLESTLAV